MCYLCLALLLKVLRTVPVYVLVFVFGSASDALLEKRQLNVGLILRRLIDLLRSCLAPRNRLWHIVGRASASGFTLNWKLLRVRFVPPLFGLVVRLQMARQRFSVERCVVIVRLFTFVLIIVTSVMLKGH